MSDESKELKSVREVLSATLEAMTRLKAKVETTEKKLSAVELTANGAIERLENLEKAIQLLMQGAPDKLQDFLSKAVEPSEESESSEESVTAKVG